MSFGHAQRCVTTDQPRILLLERHPPILNPLRQPITTLAQRRGHTNLQRLTMAAHLHLRTTTMVRPPIRMPRARDHTARHKDSTGHLQDSMGSLDTVPRNKACTTNKDLLRQEATMTTREEVERQTAYVQAY